MFTDASYKTEEQLINDLGEPDFWIDSSDYKTWEERETEDVLDKYAVYFKDSANGSCIVYGLTDRGWIVNPNLRYPLYYMMNKVQQSKESK